ncbi:MAG TPA: GAF domain-containing protein [Nitrospiraceae bacterium]|nr:GAF domain-containing protein [Nitrospiraceae bacterium]
MDTPFPTPASFSSFSPPGMNIALVDVDIKEELSRRPCRTPDYEAEHRALLQLAQAMAETPSEVLQKLIDITCEICRAHTAGLSLLEMHNGEELFRWEAVAGRYASYRNNTMPRNASPCGTTVDRNVSQLMYMAERIFPTLKADPPVVEALLLPFSLNGKAIGTIWVVAHDETRKFDAEDERIVTTLAQFAAAAWQLWSARTAAECAQRELEDKVMELETFHDIVVGRELKMMALEKEVERLRTEKTT